MYYTPPLTEQEIFIQIYILSKETDGKDVVSTSIDMRESLEVFRSNDEMEGGGSQFLFSEILVECFYLNIL